MKKFLFLIILVVVAALFYTNPSFEIHQKKINEAYIEQNPISGRVGIGKVLVQFVDYKNYYLFSTSTIREKTISVGFFNQVAVLNLDLSKVQKLIRG